MGPFHCRAAHAVVGADGRGWEKIIIKILKICGGRQRLGPAQYKCSSAVLLYSVLFEPVGKGLVVRKAE